MSHTSHIWAVLPYWEDVNFFEISIVELKINISYFFDIYQESKIIFSFLYSKIYDFVRCVLPLQLAFSGRRDP